MGFAGLSPSQWMALSIAFLASDDVGYVPGASLDVNRGAFIA